MPAPAELHTTVDFGDDLIAARGAYTQAGIQDMMRAFADLGITRVYWIYDAPGMMHASLAGVPDLTKAAADAAHARGLQLFALIKPFETGTNSRCLPHNTPWIDPAQCLRTLSGWHLMASTFVVQNPHLRIERRPTGYEHEGLPVTAIKLVKSDANETRVTKSNIEIWTSPINGDYAKLDAPYDLTDAIEERDGRRVRVLTLAGLHIPADQRYIMVRSTAADGPPTFFNYARGLMELYDSAGQLIPSTWDEGKMTLGGPMGALANLRGFLMRRHAVFSDLGKYPLPRGYGKSPGAFAFYFDHAAKPRVRALDGYLGEPNECDGQIVMARGKNMFLTGALHPIYPEVSAFWLSLVEHCIASGVDGIDVRIANHSSWSSDGEEYGFNAAVAEQYQQRYGRDVRTQPFDREKWRGLQGEYFTQFLREAKERLRRDELPLHVHVNGMIDQPRFMWRNNVPCNFTFDYEAWIEEGLVDGITLKYTTWLVDREKGIAAGNRVARLARKHGVKVYYCTPNISSCRLRAKGGEERFARTLAAPLDPSLVDGVILYEGCNYARLDRKRQRVTVDRKVRKVLAAR